jgi:hypothetical protein
LSIFANPILRRSRTTPSPRRGNTRWKKKAIALGWAKSQVRIIDEDLGVSGKVFVKRSGFDHLNAEVALGRAGILFGLEVSRLARSNADWYRLLDMCAITDTLLADSDGVYHPALFNSAAIAPFPRYYWPFRHPLAILPFPGVAGYRSDLLQRFLTGTRRASPVA